MQSGALFTEDTMVCVYFLAVVVDVGVGFETVRASDGVLVATFFPVVVFSTV
jgi:hypothetical protein